MPRPDVRAELESRLRAHLEPLELELRDDSDLHRGHPGATSGGGHFHARIVAEAFRGKTLIEQHRLVYAAVGDLMGDRVHALALSTAPPRDP